MGKGKKKDSRHRNTSNQESSGSRQASAVKANSPARVSTSERPQTTDSTTPRGKFSKRKIISNWDRYSEDEVSSKITEEKIVQRLSQLLEQSVLQTSRSDFQPSLDALRDINKDDDSEDIYSQVFDIDYDYLADSIGKFPIHKRLDLNPLYCQDVDSTTQGSSDVTLETYPLTCEAFTSDTVSGTTEHISTTSLLVLTEKTKAKPKQHETFNATPAPVKHTTTEDEDQLFSELLAAKTDIKDQFKMTPKAADHIKTSLPNVTDEENDSLLEELLAQPI